MLISMEDIFMENNNMWALPSLATWLNHYIGSFDADCQVRAYDGEKSWCPHLDLLIYMWCLCLKDRHLPFLGFYSSEILCIVGIGFSNWSLLQEILLLGKNIGLCHPIGVLMEKAHVAFLHRLISPSHQYYNGILLGEVTNGEKYCLVFGCGDFHPHKTSFWVYLHYFYPIM